MLHPFSISLVRTCPSVHMIGHDSCLPHARLHVLENLLGKAGWSPAAIWPLRLSLTRPHDDSNFEELLCDLIKIQHGARMIRPHLRSRLTFGVHCCTLPREERCGRRTNPVKSTCTSTTHQLSERAGADECLSTLYCKIDPSELAAKGCCERGGYAV